MMVLFLLLFLVNFFTIVQQSTAQSPSLYHRAHSLADNYQFDPRDGWEVVNITNLDYKYRRDLAQGQNIRSKKLHSVKGSRKNGVAGALTKFIDKALKGLTGIGKPQPVTITWYTSILLLLRVLWALANRKWLAGIQDMTC